MERSSSHPSIATFKRPMLSVPEPSVSSPAFMAIHHSGYEQSNGGCGVAGLWVVVNAWAVFGALTHSMTHSMTH